MNNDNNGEWITHTPCQSRKKDKNKGSVNVITPDMQILGQHGQENPKHLKTGRLHGRRGPETEPIAVGNRYHYLQDEDSHSAYKVQDKRS